MMKKELNNMLACPKCKRALWLERRKYPFLIPSRYAIIMKKLLSEFSSGDHNFELIENSSLQGNAYLKLKKCADAESQVTLGEQE